MKPELEAAWEVWVHDARELGIEPDLQSYKDFRAQVLEALKELERDILDAAELGETANLNCLRPRCQLQSLVERVKRRRTRHDDDTVRK